MQFAGPAQAVAFVRGVAPSASIAVVKRAPYAGWTATMLPEDLTAYRALGAVDISFKEVLNADTLDVLGSVVTCVAPGVHVCFGWQSPEALAMHAPAPTEEGLGLATVWHEGSKCFYHAKLLRTMSQQEVAAEL